jgi:hypothetical protein
MKPSRKARDRRWHLLRSAKRVGLTREVFALVVKAGGKQCAICGRRAEVNDHCHKRKWHRGRLCHRCNTALGLMKDSSKRLRDAAIYLEEFELQFLLDEIV